VGKEKVGGQIMFDFVDEGKRELYTFEEKHPKLFSWLSVLIFIIINSYLILNNYSWFILDNVISWRTLGLFVTYVVMLLVIKLVMYLIDNMIWAWRVFKLLALRVDTASKSVENMTDRLEKITNQMEEDMKDVLGEK
jgi:hypothetical protein